MSFKYPFFHSFQSFENCSACEFNFNKNSLNLSGRSVTMSYKISSENIANLSYVGESFRGEIFRGGREFSIEGELYVLTLLKKRSVIR